ncbi:MAG TPA: hypothetical protein VK669_14430, partial [Candidatus Limnocylindrales bacterium]|nr:hypothetical protein [Candidatus Limnocylindrales bacterium]
MSELLHPGVYVQEVSSGLQPIQGVSTSTAAFIGVADKGPIPGTKLPSGLPAQPVLVTSFSEYQRRFGGFRVDSFLTYAAQAFYQNGGQRLYVVRIAKGADTASVASLGSSSSLSPPTPVLQALNQGAWGNSIWVRFAPSSDGVATHFKLIVMYGSKLADAQQNIVETYDNVAASESLGTTPNDAGTLVNGVSGYIVVTAPITAVPPPQPGSPPEPATYQLQGGTDGTPGADLGDADFIGSTPTDPALSGSGLHALDKVTDVSLIAIPGRGDVETVNAGVDYCKLERPLNDCFFIADVGLIANPAAARGPNPQTTVPTVADAYDFAVKGGLSASSGDYGALYYPWVFAADPIGSGTNAKILLPPSGFVAGIYARTDNARGVFKAPAGTQAGVAGSLAPAVVVSDTNQDSLNPVYVNAVRTVGASGLVVWGARTFGAAEWRYVPVRRMAIYLRSSIYYGIQWAVFEPNDEPLWASLRLNIRAFMLTQFRAGAFQGSTPDDA